MLRAAASRYARGAIRRLSSAAAASPAAAAAGAQRQPPLDEGDWSYYREWWGEDEGAGEGAHTVFRRHSEHGNGVVSVSAYPASRPAGVSPLLQKQLEELSKRIVKGSASVNANKGSRFVVIGQDQIEPLQALQNSGQEVCVNIDKQREKRRLAENWKRKKQ